jgi:hypothetical protein
VSGTGIAAVVALILIVDAVILVAAVTYLLRRRDRARLTRLGQDAP